MRGIIHEFLSFTLIKSSSDFISLSETQKLTMIKMNQLMRYFIAFNKVELPFFESSIYLGSFLILRRPIPFSECLNKKITVIFRITHLRLLLQLSVSMLFSPKLFVISIWRISDRSMKIF